jgi:hypothetical protein
MPGEKHPVWFSRYDKAESSQAERSAEDPILRVIPRKPGNVSTLGSKKTNFSPAEEPVSEL